MDEPRWRLGRRSTSSTARIRERVAFRELQVGACSGPEDLPGRKATVRAWLERAVGMGFGCRAQGTIPKGGKNRIAHRPSEAP